MEVSRVIEVDTGVIDDELEACSFSTASRYCSKSLTTLSNPRDTFYRTLRLTLRKHKSRPRAAHMCLRRGVFEAYSFSTPFGYFCSRALEIPQKLFESAQHFLPNAAPLPPRTKNAPVGCFFVLAEGEGFGHLCINIFFSFASKIIVLRDPVASVRTK